MKTKPELILKLTAHLTTLTLLAGCAAIPQTTGQFAERGDKTCQRSAKDAATSSEFQRLVPDTTSGMNTAFTGAGSGTEADPYQISTVTQLQQMNRNLNARYVLVEDIDAKTTRSWNDGAGFEPIGSTATPFAGHFSGNSHEIVGLYINRPTNDFAGLFGQAKRAVLNGVWLVDVDITGHDWVGALAGSNADSSRYRLLTTNCCSSGIVRGHTYVGGLIGHLYDIQAEDCYSTANVEGGKHVTGTVTEEGGKYVGGLVGFLSFSKLRRCYASGAVRGEDHVGGLCGSTDGYPGYPIVVKNCFAAGQVQASGGNVGGLAGYLSRDGQFGDWTQAYYVDRRHAAPYGTYESDGPGAFQGNSAHSVFATWDFDATWKVIREPPSFPVFVRQSATEAAGAPLRLGVRLTDDSFIMGRPASSTLSVVTSYGRITLPLETVIRIRMAGDHETAVFEMQKGDRVSGIIDSPRLVLETVFGKLRIDMILVRQIEVYPARMPAPKGRTSK